ncbi:hypothetical protein [Pseudomonas sp. PICF141]|uniref:hypothetical protein n=1 Tax=Pseudomonas sp. PICF141 TaxID=1949067 RepID=UPI0011799DD6|nr:hypothetical protein [Pseudomonas sp. PICF141]
MVVTLRRGISNRRTKADQLTIRKPRSTVGAAEGCDLLILIFGGFMDIKTKIKRSQPSAAPTGVIRRHQRGVDTHILD